MHDHELNTRMDHWYNTVLVYNMHTSRAHAAKYECILSEDPLVTPCENDATCIDEVGGYGCECTSDFTGVNCTEESELITSGFGQVGLRGLTTCLSSSPPLPYLTVST